MSREAQNLLIPFRRDKKRDFAVGSGEALLASKVRQALLTEGATARSSGELPWRTNFGAGLALLRHQRNDAALKELRPSGAPMMSRADHAGVPRRRVASQRPLGCREPASRHLASSFSSRARLFWAVRKSYPPSSMASAGRPSSRSCATTSAVRSPCG